MVKADDRVGTIAGHLAPSPVSAGKEYTMEEVAKHNTKDDCWVVVNGQVLDATSFLPDHPGGKKAILLYAGKDATEEFNMLHKPDVVEKYAPEIVLGKLQMSPASAGPKPSPVVAEADEDHAPVPIVTGGPESFSKPNNPVSLKPMGNAVPSETEGPMSGGTAGILPMERKKATFDTEKLINAIDGGVAKTKRRRFIISPSEGTDASDKYYTPRADVFKSHVKHFNEVHEDYWGKLIPTREEVAWMIEYTMNSGSLMNHYGLFLPTIIGQASEEQMGEWATRALTMAMVGSYAQTELGHGSNVRGLRTTATYDKSTEEFVLNTPTLQSMKWWPGALGKTGTHALVYAQLIIDGKEYGVHIFMVQIRDDKHRPYPGIEVGDVGPKLGDHANDTGFLRLENVRIPREHMLAKYQTVSPDGTYTKASSATNSKLHYATMMQTRGVMVRTAGGQLARAATIAVRYSCVRKQGFKDTRPDAPYRSEERQIIDYSVQRYRVFKQLAHAYAFKFTGKWMIDKFAEMEAGQGVGVIGDTSALPEIAATSAGLKGLCTFLTAQGIEDCRKCCGGNGYLMNSGVAALAADYVWQTTAEGDWVVMILQTARFLIKSLQAVRKGENVVGPCMYLKAAAQPGFNLEKARPPQARGEADFANFDYLLHMFQYRALCAVVVVTDEFEALLKGGMQWDEAWNKVANELFDAVVWHCHTFILANFVSQVNGVEDPAVKKALADVCVMYALSNMIDGQWAGVLSLREAKMVRDCTRTVMERMRPNCVALVDGFDIPDRVLNSTLGRFDGNVYEALYEATKRNPLNFADPYVGYNECQRPYLDMEMMEHGNQPISKL